MLSRSLINLNHHGWPLTNLYLWLELADCYRLWSTNWIENSLWLWLSLRDIFHGFSEWHIWSGLNILFSRLGDSFEFSHSSNCHLLLSTSCRPLFSYIFADIDFLWFYRICCRFWIVVIRFFMIFGILSIWSSIVTFTVIFCRRIQCFFSKLYFAIYLNFTFRPCLLQPSTLVSITIFDNHFFELNRNYRFDLPFTPLFGQIDFIWTRIRLKFAIFLPYSLLLHVHPHYFPITEPIFVYPILLQPSPLHIEG